MIRIIGAHRMRWPIGHHGFQFGAHVGPGWGSLYGGSRHRWTVTFEFAAWRLDVGVGRP